MKPSNEIIMEQKEKIIASYNFSDMDRNILDEVLDIDVIFDREIFNDWFNYKYEIPDYELIFLTTLLKSQKNYLQYYNEVQLKSQFISPLLSLVNFSTDKFKGWYERHLSGIVNNYELKGNTDFMVATGKLKPKKPFFFIQEFKKNLTKSNPLEQVLAEMAVAMEINQTNILRGTYNVGKIWNFIVLEKTKQNKYQYYESKSFDSSEIEDLKQIYINLQAVKHKYCK